MVLYLSHTGDLMGKVGILQDGVVGSLQFVIADIPSDALVDIP